MMHELDTAPDLNDLSSAESARERAKRSKKAAAAAAAALGVTFPEPSETKTGADQLSCAELWGAAHAAYDLYKIAIAEGLGGGYAAYYHALGEAYTTAAASCKGLLNTTPEPDTPPDLTDLSSEESARERAKRAKKAAAAAAAALGVTFSEPYETRTGVDQLSCADLWGAHHAAHQMEMIAIAEGLGGGYAAYYHGLAEAYGHAAGTCPDPT